MDIDEIFAEKMRAALTRKEPAIRDFFDIWYAKHQKFDFKHIRNFIDQKVAEVDFQYTIDEAYDELYQQIETELHPVLKNNSTYDFNLEEIYDFILSFKK